MFVACLGLLVVMGLCYLAGDAVAGGPVSRRLKAWAMVEEEPTSADWQEAANQAAALASDADAQARMLWAIVADFRQKAREGENAKKLD